MGKWQGQGQTCVPNRKLDTFNSDRYKVPEGPRVRWGDAGVGKAGWCQCLGGVVWGGGAVVQGVVQGLYKGLQIMQGIAVD